jgi:hypothetical protein
MVRILKKLKNEMNDSDISVLLFCGVMEVILPY